MEGVPGNAKPATSSDPPPCRLLMCSGKKRAGEVSSWCGSPQTTGLPVDVREPTTAQLLDPKRFGSGPNFGGGIPAAASRSSGYAGFGAPGGAIQYGAGSPVEYSPAGSASIAGLMSPTFAEASGTSASITVERSVAFKESERPKA